MSFISFSFISSFVCFVLFFMENILLLLRLLQSCQLILYMSPQIFLQESIEFMFWKKSNKPMAFLNNRILRAIVARVRQFKMRPSERQWKKQSSSSYCLSKLDKTCSCLFFVSSLFYFVFYYKSFASTDITTNQILIHIALKIWNAMSNWYFFHGTSALISSIYKATLIFHR